MTQAARAMRARRVCPRSANGAGDLGFTARDARTGARRRRGAAECPTARARRAVDAGGARSDGGLPAKARRAWGPSFGEGPADRSAEARNARSRRIGKPELRRGRLKTRRRAGCARSLGTFAFHHPSPFHFPNPRLPLFPAFSGGFAFWERGRPARRAALAARRTHPRAR